MSRGRERQWSRESEQTALERLFRDRPTLLVYTRQSRSDVDSEGRVIGISLDQQANAWRSRPELAYCPVEVFSDRDRSGKETSRRTGYQAMLERLCTTPA